MNNGLLIDIEGTLVVSGTPLPGAIEFIDYLNRNGIKYNLITNTVSKTIEQYETIFNEIGFKINKEKIINPIIVLNEYLTKNNVNNYFFIGPDRLKNLLPKISENNNPDYIVFCDFENIELNYELFNKIFYHIRNGAKIVATSYTDYYASKNEIKMDTGIFVKMYEMLTKEKAVIIGKPSPIIYEMALNKLGMDRNNVIVIGDDGFSDIIGGKEAGMKTILVKTGIYQNGDEEKYQPNKTVNNPMEIIKEIG